MDSERSYPRIEGAVRRLYMRMMPWVREDEVVPAAHNMVTLHQREPDVSKFSATGVVRRAIRERHN